jgi:4-hydroxymandelate oxidase
MRAYALALHPPAAASGGGPHRATTRCGTRTSRRGADGIITTPTQALNFLEFEPAAKKALFDEGAPTHWGYLESGVDGDVTRDANHTAYAKYKIRVQR